MNESRTMILHLYQDLPYREVLSEGLDATRLSCAMAFDSIMSRLDNCETGTDACICCEAKLADEIVSRSCRRIVYSEPSRMSSTPVETLPAGDYRFLQIPYAPEKGEELEPLIGSFLLDLTGEVGSTQSFFIRLFKERPLVVVVQLFAPTQTRKE